MKYPAIMPIYPIVDLMVQLEGEYPIYSDSTRYIDGISPCVGGHANILYTLKRLGTSILPVGVIGDDYYGKLLRNEFASEGIETDKIVADKNYETLKTIVVVDGDKQHTFLTMRGIKKYPNDIEIIKMTSDCGSLIVSGYMLAENEDVTIQLCNMIRVINEQKKPIFFDPGPALTKISSEVLEYTLRASSVVSLNLNEALLITGVADLDTAAIILRKMTNALILIKMGDKGCCVLSLDDEKKTYPGFHIELCDTTGAGDAFLGAFIHAYLHGWQMERAVIFANAAGAVMATKFGSGKSSPTKSEIYDLLLSNGFVFYDS
ncbi:MAG: carbohydrate kinase family protein [Anaerolineaceae bacterium]